MGWLTKFADASAETDRLRDRSDHHQLLAAGLIGEVGSVLAEIKKQERELAAYPVYRHRMSEEIGDFLWYLVRLIAVTQPSLLSELDSDDASDVPVSTDTPMGIYLKLGAAVGDVLGALEANPQAPPELRSRLRHVWYILGPVSGAAGVSLERAAKQNVDKVQSRWPREKTYLAPFDGAFPEEERLPRQLDLEFRERVNGDRSAVVVRCNGLNVGDRLTDNIRDPDGYRYHDVFHFAHLVHLGWSPVVRAILRCKRKSSPALDEAEDGARAAIIEEAVSAIVFSRAKQLGFFEGLSHLDYDLLKTIREFVDGYEVERVPLWQWETAILKGYEVFRQLKANKGGRVVVDLMNHELAYSG